MNDETAYAIYAAKQRELGVVVDDWNDLDDVDQEAWNFTTTQIWEHGYNARLVSQ